MKYKNITILTISTLATIFSGCSEVSCKPGLKLDKDKEHCLVTNKPLKGVIESIDCKNDNNCSAIIVDERNRKIKISANSNTKIGDEVNIFLYKDPIKK
jgi:hypothetical protein